MLAKVSLQVRGKATDLGPALVLLDVRLLDDNGLVVIILLFFLRLAIVRVLFRRNLIGVRSAILSDLLQVHRLNYLR